MGIRAVTSLGAACDQIIVGEGPLGETTPLPQRWPPIRHTEVIFGSWETDAAKRTFLLNAAKAWASGRKFWIVWIDGDELMLWGENLPLWIARAEYGDPELKETGGFPLRLVELTGATVMATGRVIRGDIIEEYRHSIVEVKLTGMETSHPLPNLPNWAPGEPVTAYNRPPLHGEPHYLHLSSLRDPARQAQRQSEAETEGYEARAKALGIYVPG